MSTPGCESGTLGTADLLKIKKNNKNEEKPLLLNFDPCDCALMHFYFINFLISPYKRVPLYSKHSTNGDLTFFREVQDFSLPSTYLQTLIFRLAKRVLTIQDFGIR